MINMDKIMNAAAVLIGETIRNKAIGNLDKNFSVGNGQFRNSIKAVVIDNGNKIDIKVGPANLVYAAIHEFGGTITPDTAGALAIPIHPDAKKAATNDKRRIRDVFPDLTLIKRPGKPSLLVRKIEKGRNQRFDLMYILLSSVKIPARPYMRPALYEAEKEINGILRKAGLSGGLA